MGKKKPGVILYFDEWNMIINKYSYAEIGNLAKCAFLYAQREDITNDFNNLSSELQGIWMFICNALIRSDISYSETIVKRAWGGYKKNHNLSDTVEIGSTSFIEWYISSPYYDERLFKNNTWYDSVLEHANSKRNLIDKSIPNDTVDESVKDNSTVKESETQKETGKGYGGRSLSATVPSVLNASPEELQNKIAQIRSMNK